MIEGKLPLYHNIRGTGTVDIQNQRCMEFYTVCLPLSLHVYGGLSHQLKCIMNTLTMGKITSYACFTPSQLHPHLVWHEPARHQSLWISICDTHCIRWHIPEYESPGLVNKIKCFGAPDLCVVNHKRHWKDNKPQYMNMNMTCCAHGLWLIRNIVACEYYQPACPRWIL